MAIHYSLDYYLKIGYLPILSRFRLQDINFEYGCFIGIDVCFPLYKVLDMKAQSLENTWGLVNNYVDNALQIVTEDYNEDIGLGENEKLRDVDREIIREIECRLGDLPEACYPIYIITVGDGEEEEIVYIGKTSAKNHRFSGGHSAALKLHDPMYEGKMKSIYFGTVTFLSNKNEYMPLEFIQPYKDASDLLESLEAGLIFNIKPELNSTHRNKNNASFNMIVNIENHSERQSIFQYKQVFIESSYKSTK